jgi:hypothetical protein
MERTLQHLNALEASDLVSRYALGGALAAMFYAEAVVTEDLDAFVLLASPAAGLITLTPIYDFLKARGAVERREHLLIEGVLVQVIPAYDDLTEEAVREAVDQIVGKTSTRVMRVEHLIAIALRTGRVKDHARIGLLLDEAVVDTERLTDIVQRHDLGARWNQFASSHT